VEKIIEEINKLPIFETRDVAIKDNNKYIDNDRFKAVVMKDNPEVVVAIVSKKYNLIQFKDVFIPAIQKLPEIEFWSVENHLGKACLEVYPKGQEFFIDSDKRIGLVLKNSVDKAWAIKINFAINSRDFPTIYLPTEIVGVRKIHIGTIEIENFIEVLAKVKQVWNDIVEKLKSYQFEADELDEFAKQVKIGKKVKKKLEKMIEEKTFVSLWDIFVKVISEITRRKYKSNISRRRKLESVSEAILKYALILRL